MAKLRSDQYQILATIDDIDTGEWDEFEGGDLTVDAVKDRPGDTGIEESLGGLTSVENVTIRRSHNPLRDNLHAWRQASGTGRMVVTVRARSKPGGPAIGRPDIYSGTVGNVTRPSVTSQGGERALVAVICDTDGRVG